MKFYTWKLIDVGTIAAGSTSSGSWTSDDDYTIKRIIAVETSETAVGLQFLTATFRVDGYVFTKDSVNLALLGGYSNQVPELDIDIKKGQTFNYSITNNHSTNNISVQLILELWK